MNEQEGRSTGPFPSAAPRLLQIPLSPPRLSPRLVTEVETHLCRFRGCVISLVDDDA